MKLLIFALFIILYSAALGQGTLLVANKNENTVSIISLGSFKELSKIPTGKGPHEVAVSPTGKIASIANYGDKQNPGNSLTVVDVSTMKNVSEINLGEYPRPHGMEFINEDEVLVTCETKKVLLRVNVKTGTVSEVAKTDQQTSHMVAYSPSDRRAYVAAIVSGTVSAIDVTNNKLIRNIEFKRGIEGIAASPDGKEVWVANRDDSTVIAMSTATFEKLGTMPAHQVAYRIKFLPNGKSVVVSNGISGNITVYDVKTKKLVHEISLKDDTMPLNENNQNMPVPVGMAVSNDSKFVFVSLAGYNKVAMINTKNWTVARLISVGDGPDGIYYSSVDH